MKMDMHLHSKFSDGENTIDELVEKALELGYNMIAITDHVRRTTDWLDEYVAEIELARRKYPKIKIYSGIEAKVIDLEGNIDAQEWFFDKVDLVLSAFHRIPKGEDIFLSKDEIYNNKAMALDLWYRGFVKVLENKNVHIIAHPTAILRRFEIEVPLEMKKDIARKVKKNRKIIELNIRYKVPDTQLFKLLCNEGVYFSIGSDSHNLKDLEQASIEKFCKELIEKYNYKFWVDGFLLLIK
ncbi:MAG: PHP domain-containing protein [Candidatus Poribacteria bacterium]